MSGVVKTLRRVGQHFCRDERTIRRWCRAGMPRRGDRSYDLKEIEEWLKRKRYLGSNFRQMEREETFATLFEIATLELRRGLEHLCTAFVSARGKTRARLIDRAIKGIIQGTMTQASLLVDPEEPTP